MRLLDGKKINYVCRCYADTDAVAGLDVAAVLGENPSQVFKTLVTQGKTKNYYVFVVPVNKELDLKKAAGAVGEKNIEMIKSKDLLPLTGYIHGGCSPLGMKKQFVTVFDKTAADYETVMFSAGKIGYQVEVKLEDIKPLLKFGFADITV